MKTSLEDMASQAKRQLVEAATAADNRIVEPLRNQMDVMLAGLPYYAMPGPRDAFNGSLNIREVRQAIIRHIRRGTH